MKRYALLALSPLFVMLMGGCSKYLDGYYYAPRPALVEVPAQDPKAVPPVSSLVSVVGIHVKDHDEHLPLSVEVRMRLENNGPGTLTFDPGSLQLMDGSLLQFRPPILDQRTPITLPPMRAAVVSAFFPFPQGHDNHNTDLEVLQMRWQIRTDDHNGEMGTTFHRVYAPPPVPYWYDPVYPYPYGFYGGVVIIHRGGRWR